MAKRTAEGLVRYAEAHLGARYWNGTWGQVASQWLYDYNKGRLPSHYGSSRTEQYQKDIKNGKRVFDCAGLIKGYMWSDKPSDIPIYLANSFPDVNESGLKKRCIKSDVISTIPETPGVLVFSNGHVGVYIGGGKVIEARGFDYGVVKTNLGDRPWKTWGMLSDLSYDKAPEFTLTRLLRFTLFVTCKGEDVRWVQKRLIKLGYNVGPDGADGKYGRNTKNAVIAFQRNKRLAQDGIVGKDTITALGGVWAG